MKSRFLTRSAVFAVLALVVPSGQGHAQFNVPLPKPIPAEQVFREDMQMLFHGFLFPGIEPYRERADSLRGRAAAALAEPAAAIALESDARRFCTARFREPNAQCLVALEPDSILERFGEGGTGRPLSRTYVKSWIPFFFTSRPYVAEYLRQSGGGDAFAVASQFAANVGENEAYLVSTVARGLVGRGIFSADQALVVARSGDPDPAKREAIESDKANALRAVNNGGTLVARYTMPMYARAGSTAASAVGLSVSAGVLGPISGDGNERTGSASTALEGLVAFPLRDLGGNSGVLAELMVGFRGGYTDSGRSLRMSGGAQDVTFGQMIIGLRQNGTMSVSALVTVANHGINDLVPRLVVNFAARR
jgi:hypothetical protein